MRKSRERLDNECGVSTILGYWDLPNLQLCLEIEFQEIAVEHYPDKNRLI